MRRLVFAVVLVLAGVVGFPGVDALEVPYLAQRVTDLADLLDPGAEERLEQRLQAIETETGAQVAVLTVPSLDGEVLEDYALRVAESWKLGREGVDDGVLVLVARDDRKVRIEVGYGLEGTITDLESRRIIDGRMVPAFRQGDFGAGIEGAVDSIGGAIRGEPDAIPPAAPSGESLGEGDMIVWLFILGSFGWSALAKPGRGGWMLWLVLAPFFFFAAHAAFGSTPALVVLGLWLVVGGLLRLVWPESLRPRARPGRSGSWIGGGSRGGGFSGFSGGGFSGGGGSFGGGGASGSW